MDEEYLLELGLSPEHAQAVLGKHNEAIKELTFQSQLREAITAAGGRSIRAVGAMLDLEQLKNADEPHKALEQALRQLKAESGYLFADAPPPLAQDVGKKDHSPKPVTLAGAIRQKYERK